MTQGVALVTGGGGGIGTAISRALGAQGLRVVSTCIDPEAEAMAQWTGALQAEGVDAHYVTCNVADATAVARMGEVVAEAHGPVAVLVNAAGITRDGFAHKMRLEDWQAVIDINLSGAFQVTRQVIGGMRERGFGRIVNIASVNGQTGQIGQANYAASKAGLHGLTMALAREGAGKNVTANTVSPGYIRTPMTAAMPESVLEGIVASVPAGRLGEPEEIARVVAFLAAPEAGYINGANIPVNGALFCSF